MALSRLTKHGRVVARDGEQLLLRCNDGPHLHTPAGHAKPGDLVRVTSGEDPDVVVSYSGTDYPEPGTELYRLSEERIAGLRARATVLREIRHYFAEHDFLEVQPPTLVPTPGLEVNIRAIGAGEGYLITSPEFAMKRLLAGGLERIYATSACFRAEEVGSHHNTEFTMLEWYRGWAGLDEILWDTEQLVRRSVQAVRGKDSALVDGREIDLSGPWRKLTVSEAFTAWCGFTLVGDESAAELRRKMSVAGIEVGGTREWDDLFYLAFVERIDPELARLDHALVLVDWPSALAALARVKPENPRWALRFEVYIGGVELANAFDELTCAKEQRRRFEHERQQRNERGLPVYEIDEKFLAALEEGLPPSAGIALGVDRLAMLSVSSDELRTVCAFIGDEL